MSRRLAAALGAAAIAAAAFAPSTTAPAATATSIAASTIAAALPSGPTTDAPAPTEHVQEDFTLESHDGTVLHYTLFRPAGADADNPVPLIFSSHGWGGSRTKDMDVWMDAGFGGLSFDQRGFGQSEGLANVQDPELEGKDVAALLDVVQSLPWVARDLDADTSVFGPTDPTVFAIGGSYGGGYQTIGALTEIADHGDTRFDALSPEITWYDLPESLGPQLVARSAWLTLLFAAGVNDVPDFVKTAYVYGASTGQFPDGTAPGTPDLVEIFNAHSPQGFVEGGTYLPDGGVRLNIPALWRQGSSDTLFNLNQGIQNLEQMDPSVADESFMIGYNGGHVLPTAMPRGTAGGTDTCSVESAYGGWTEMRIAWFTTVAEGGSTADFLPYRYGITDMDGNCVWTDDVRSGTTFPVGYDVEVTTGAASNSGAGAPQYLPVLTAEETVTIAGIPTVDATWYSAGADQRLFFGLAKGTSPADATVMQHQMMPHRELLPSTGHDVTVELGGGGVTVEAGETLYLVVSPFVDLYFGHGSTRTPGVVALEDITLHLPLQD